MFLTIGGYDEKHHLYFILSKCANVLLLVNVHLQHRTKQTHDLKVEASSSSDCS